jgi:hypothetical protein
MRSRADDDGSTTNMPRVAQTHVCVWVLKAQEAQRQPSGA